MRLDNSKAENNEKQGNIKDEFKDRIADLDKYYSDVMEEMSTNIEQVRIMARDSVNAKEKELTDLMNKQINSIKEFVDENIEDMV